ncbi:restriction endonuclease subunit S [Staphylococcus cohnii]
MTEQIRNPKLRFRDNKGNDYSPWNLYSIKDVAKISSGKSKKNENKGRYIIMDMGTVTKNGTMLTHKITPYENDLLKKGDLVMVKDDIGGGHIIGKTIFIPESQKYVLGDHVYRLEPKNYDGLFLHYCINSPIVNRSLKRKVTGSAQLGLNRKSVEEELIKVPRLEEQEKIGRFFSKLDRQIELEEQKLAKLEEQKKGYTQKIFSQELRFKDENGADYPNWKKKTIKEVANLTAGKSKKNENKGKYIIMDMGTVTKNGTMLTHKSTRYESDLLNKGDLVMPKDDIGGGHIIGKTVFIPESHKYVLGDHVYRLEIKNCNSLFLHYYINSDIVNHSLKRKVTGSAQLGLNRKSVEEEVIKTPCLEEQGKIGNLFNKIDNLIENQSNKLELLKERKKGFLQKMFI